MNNLMKTQKTKLLQEWVDEVNVLRKEYWDKRFSYRPYVKLKVSKGRKFIKLVDNGCVWGFVCMIDGTHAGAPVKKGDLMKPASRNAAAKHARGNIFDGTANFSYQGPSYL